MRLVFLLYAEERETFPDDPLFTRNYAIAGLFARLVEDEGRHPDTMDQRYGAWAHLISLFRLVYNGTSYDGPDGGRVEVPARHGRLFDPERFPFLEGRPLATEPGGRHPLPRVADGTVLRVLRNLLYLGQERLSYRSLEVEQIGSVYEAVMGYRVEAARGRSVAIRPEKRGGAPVTISLDDLLAMPANARGKWFKETTDRKLATAAASAIRAARTETDLVSALDRLIDRRLTPAPVPAGSLVVQPSTERRRSGSHYTPRSLTGPIVTKALEPILARLGPDPTPDALLGLKVCDPAMGSGAFLVEAMRQLARLLVDAWARHGLPGRIPRDETPLLYASRLIARRCLYGVDKNPMAVDLAKLSLWLSTLAKDHAFSFLDHNLRHGDSLVGLSLAQIQACHWSADPQATFASDAIRRLLVRVLADRRAILSAPEDARYEQLSDLRMTADGWLDRVRRLGDAVLGVFFEGGTASARNRRREDLSLTIRDSLSDSLDIPTQLVLRAEIDRAVSVLKGGATPVEPFHWDVEFPEVFLGTDPDGSLRRRADGGFDAIVGNPPFAGKNTMAEGNAKAFPDWLKEVHPESHGNADLVAHFFRRSFNLLRPGGSFGLIATNTIGQGDTRSTGLRWIGNHGGTIYAARKRLKWPGEAAVVVSVVHVHKGELPGPFDLDGREVKSITAYLFHAGGHDDPERLHTNAGKSFVGSYVLGMGFTFDDTDKKGIASPLTLAKALEIATAGDRPFSMEELIERDNKNRDRIFPYIGGREINDSPKHEYHRHVINFAQMSEADASKWPDLMQIVEQRVKPERLRLGDGADARTRKKNWWLWGRYTPSLFQAMAGIDRALACSMHQPHWIITFVNSKFVYSHALAIFALDSSSSIAILQSRPHELWARFFGSSLEDRLRYTPSDCFETFPFPPGWETNADLESVGKTYYEYRAQLLIDTNLGLTKTYNRFHDPKERSGEIGRLRELHAAMDRAVLAAYEWTDVDSTCGFDLDWCEAEAADEASAETIERLESGRYFFETADAARAFAADLVGLGKSLPWRYRWRPEVRDDVLARLLLLNGQRAEAERIAGLAPLDAGPSDEDEDLDIDDEGVDDDPDTD